jgi:cell division protein FtsA
MPKENVVAAIDVGSSKISSVVAFVTDGKISVAGTSGASDSKGVAKGSIVHIDDVSKAIDKSVSRSDRMSTYQIKSAYVSINGSHILSVNSPGVVAITNESGEITRQDVERALQSAKATNLPSSREVIHVLEREFKVDDIEGIKDPVGMSGSRLEVQTTIVHVSSMVAKNLRKAISTFGISIDDIVYTGIAAGESVLTDSERELGVLLLDIGAQTTSMVVYSEGGPVFCTTIPIGGKHITNDIAIAIRANMDVAEKIKIKLSADRDFKPSSFESAKFNDSLNPIEFGLEAEPISKRYLYSIIDQRLDEIFRLVLAELQQHSYLNRIPAGVVLTGGSAKTFGIEKVCKGILKLPVKIGYPKGVEGLIDEVSDPEFAVSVGMILYGTKRIQKKNLLSPSKSNDIFKGIINKFLNEILPQN